jgi:TonB family protein
MELESVRASVNDASVRNITALMLIGIYLEEGNYVRPVALLDEVFQQRAKQKDDSVRTYFALAGQAINGVRTRLARYRSFGINVSDSTLPKEALTDLDQMRFLLERLISQANDATNENGRAYDAWALKEDVLGIRLSLARDDEDRDKWQAEYTTAREKLASRQVQIASIGRPPALEAVTAKMPNPFSGPKPAASPEANTNNVSSQSTNSSTPTAPSVKTEPTASPSPSASQPNDKPFTTGSLNGRERKRVTPQYPQVARNGGVAGTVRVYLVVDENGNPTVERSEGPMLLRQAAEDAARKWLFRPTLIDNKPVRLAGYLDFEFKL